MNNPSIYQDNPTSPATWRGLTFPHRAGYTSMNPYTTKIICELEKVSAIGADYNTIFDDWLEITLATLEALPAHLKAARTTGKLADDTEETKKLWERLRVRYHRPYCWERFQNAFHLLLESAQDNWDDVIGEVYMEFGIANKRNGQFFTPYPNVNNG